MSTEPESRFLAWPNDPEYPDPKPEDLERPEFQAVWNAIKQWDLSRRPNTESTRLYAGASGSDVMHILNALPPQLAADQVRENIRAYLQHIADIDIGTVLSPQGREIVGFCASWVQNRLDEEWLADKVVPLASAKAPSPVETRDEIALLQERLRGEREYASAVLQDLQQARASEQRAVNAAEALRIAERREITARKEAEETVEALRADLEEERKYRDRAEVQLEAVRREAKLWEAYSEGIGDSHTSMHRVHALVITPDILHPTGRCSCGGEGRCDWCKANPDPYQAEGTEASEAMDEFEPDVEGVMEALQDTQAYIATCLEADVKLEAVRKVVVEAEAAIDRRSDSPAEAEHRQSVAYARIQKLVQAPGDTGNVA